MTASWPSVWRVTTTIGSLVVKLNSNGKRPYGVKNRTFFLWDVTWKRYGNILALSAS